MQNQSWQNFKREKSTKIFRFNIYKYILYYYTNE